MQELSYLEKPARLDEILGCTEEMGFDMASDPRTGGLLKTLAASKQGGRFLELGTGTGIATAWILDGMDQHSRLTSVDADGRVQEVARLHLAGDTRLTLVADDALGFLQRQGSDTFDFMFADAMPGKYEGLEEALRVLKPGGFYIVDDMLPQPNWPEGHAGKVPVLIEALCRNAVLHAMPLAWASGLVLAAKR